MIQNNNAIRKIANKLSPKFIIIEFVLIFIASVFVLLKYLNYTTINPLLVVSISLLSLFYFLMGISINENIKDNIKLAFIGKANG